MIVRLKYKEDKKAPNHVALVRLVLKVEMKLIKKKYLHVFCHFLADCRLAPNDPIDREVSYWYYEPGTNQHQ